MGSALQNSATAAACDQGESTGPSSRRDVLTTRRLERARVEATVHFINSIIWSKALIFVCLGAGLFFSLRTRFMQIRGFFEMCRLTVRGEKSDAGVSSFQALAMSMAGRMGIGNIAGVATAIAFGGPGAIFWMWVMGFLAHPPRTSNAPWRRSTRPRTPKAATAVARRTTSKRPWA